MQSPVFESPNLESFIIKDEKNKLSDTVESNVHKSLSMWKLKFISFNEVVPLEYKFNLFFALCTNPLSFISFFPNNFQFSTIHYFTE